MGILLSVCLTTVLSFTAPLILVGGVLVALSVTRFLPGLALCSQAGSAQIVIFLSVFGSGYPVQGILTIGCTCGLVGGLFDLFKFYKNSMVA